MNRDAFQKSCGHAAPRFGCRGCIAKAVPTPGNVAQTGHTLSERIQLMDMFMEEEREQRGVRAFLRARRAAHAERREQKALRKADAHRTARCGHTAALRFGCLDCEMSVRLYRSVLGKPAEAIEST